MDFKHPKLALDNLGPGPGLCGFHGDVYQAKNLVARG
jgi:hypothetical protein